MWRLMAGQALAHRCWDDEFVVYNDLSGDTHVLGTDAMAVLLHLGKRQADEGEIAHALDLGPDEHEGLHVVLVELSRLALVERV